MAEQSAEDLAKTFENLSAQWDKLCDERHIAGAKEYGQFTFLGNDVTRMMMEELADTANYCRMQYIKLMLLQFALEEEIGTKLDGADGTVTIGVQSFKGAGEVGW